MASAVRRKFIDIGVNLTDPMYAGMYHGSRKHQPDLQEVLQRAWSAGLQKMMITGGSLQDSREALKLASTHDKLFTTVGCHPTRCKEFEESGSPDSYLQSLLNLAAENKDKVVAVGECGLDYDRLEFCPKDIQKKYFEQQIEVAESVRLPMFLHCRNSAADLVEILSKNRDRIRAAVVHSFDGSQEDAQSIIDQGFSIGINGCSLKTQENLEVMANIPSEWLMLETDAPWCEIRPSHAGARHVTTVVSSVKKEKWQTGCIVKGRNEPCNIVQVLEVMAAVREEDIESLGDIIYKNTMKMFFPEEYKNND